MGVGGFIKNGHEGKQQTINDILNIKLGKKQLFQTVQSPSTQKH